MNLLKLLKKMNMCIDYSFVCVFYCNFCNIMQKNFITENLLNITFKGNLICYHIHIIV